MTLQQDKSVQYCYCYSTVISSLSQSAKMKPMKQSTQSLENITTHLAQTVFRVGLGLGLGVKALLLTGCCRDGEKHCLPSRVGDNDTGPLP